MVERKRALKALIAGSKIRFSEGFDVDPNDMLERACEMGLEGIVSKRRDSRYRSGRTNDWIRTTCVLRETLAIAGYSMKEERFDGLYLGRWKGKQLLDAGKVELGFTKADISDRRARLDRLAQPAAPYAVAVRSKTATWARPELLAEIEYRGRSQADQLRHPRFKGLREDL